MQKNHVMYEHILRNTLSFLEYALQGRGVYNGNEAMTRRYNAAVIMPTEAEFLEWLRFGQMQKVRQAWRQYGKEITGKENFFSVVLFLARDKSLYAKEAFEMYSSAYADDPRLKMISQFLDP